MHKTSKTAATQSFKFGAGGHVAANSPLRLVWQPISCYRLTKYRLSPRWWAALWRCCGREGNPGRSICCPHGVICPLNEALPDLTFRLDRTSPELPPELCADVASISCRLRSTGVLRNPFVCCLAIGPRLFSPWRAPDLSSAAAGKADGRRHFASLLLAFASRF